MKLNDYPHLLHLGINHRFYGDVTFGENTIVGDYVVIGYPKESRLEEFQRGHNCAAQSSSPFDSVKPTIIGANCRISSHTVIYEGTRIGDDVSIDDFCRIGFDCIIGSKTRLSYAAFVMDRVQIGDGCVIEGFVCDGAIIGNHAIVLGKLLHELTRPHVPWGLIEPAPRIEDKAVVGMGAIIVGGVTIGYNSYVAAGAVVTKDVPAKSMVIGVNRIIPWKKWQGKKLSRSFWNCGEKGDE